MCSFPAAYERDLEADIIGDTSGHFQKMLVVLLQVSPPWGPKTLQSLLPEHRQRAIHGHHLPFTQTRWPERTPWLLSYKVFLVKCAFPSPNCPFLSSNLRWFLSFPLGVEYDGAGPVPTPVCTGWQAHTTLLCVPRNILSCGFLPHPQAPLPLLPLPSKPQ